MRNTDNKRLRTRAGRVRDSLVIVLVTMVILAFAALSDTFTATAEEPPKVWGTVVRLEPNDVVMLKGPAGLEMRLHGNTTTITWLRPENS